MFTLFWIAFALSRKPYRIGLLFTQEQLWRADFCDGTKLPQADLESGASHIG